MEKCGEFDFNILYGKVFVVEDTKFKLQIKGSKRFFLIDAGTKKDMLLWT